MTVVLPTESGAYRWLYLDVTTERFTAVVIFMLGSVFSPRYSIGASKGALPLQHSAVNFALYEHGGRWLWALSEYSNAEVKEHGKSLCIGHSCWRYRDDGSIEVNVLDRTAPWGQPVQARVVLEPEHPPLGELTLVEGTGHRWHPIAPRARARLEVRSHDLTIEGTGYHDGNHGPELLGSSVPGWRWTRSHHAHETRVLYEPPGQRVIDVRVSREGNSVQWVSKPPVHTERTAWGLPVPERLDALAGAKLEPPHLLESSPFYARVEANGEGVQSLGEVADFKRFHSPYVRWMAGFRTRVAEAP